MSEFVPWSIIHRTPAGEHEAWRQRAVLVGDFRAGVEPIAHYVTDAEGRAADPREVPHCAGCGAVPLTDDLDLMDLTSGRRYDRRPTLAAPDESGHVLVVQSPRPGFTAALRVVLGTPEEGISQ